VNAETTITFGRALQRWSAADFVVTETLHAAGLRLPLHDHEAANVTIVLRGGFEERGEQRSFYARRGSVIVKPAGARHASVYGTSDVECVTIEVPAAARVTEVRHFTTPKFALAAERLRDHASNLGAEELLHEIIGATHELREANAEWLSTVEQILRDEDETPSLSMLAAAVRRIRRMWRANSGRGTAVRSASSRVRGASTRRAKRYARAIVRSPRSRSTRASTTRVISRTSSGA
jgi:quercetin dioxygenase-like cupin family protein